MEQTQQFYEEDQATKMDAIDKQEAGLRRGDSDKFTGEDGDKSYVPKGGISIGR